MAVSKKYNFAASTSLLIAIFSTLAIGVFLFILFEIISAWLLLLFLISFILSFFILQYRVERFIYSRIKKIYEDVRLLDEKSFSTPSITTDMEVLTREVERFAHDKKLEIETLNIRENYRKEFMGNI